MITVSATAVGVWIKFPMPALEDRYPNSIGWVLAVLGVGAVISLVAAYGYKMVARVANIAAPWMVLVFLAFGLIGLQQFITATETEINSLGDLWRLAKTEIWKGGKPLPGQVKFTFWHVAFFAWFCNMAMHVGMSDLTVFRYARKSWYAVASAAGMYVGHFMAWICAALLYAYQLHIDPADTKVLPGPLAYRAAGLAGVICVIIAGWTTANPTIYRAGLAFQAIRPKTSRFVVTLLTGLVATIAGMFPAIAMKLLDFVMLYGMLLMPMGAVIFVDFYLIKKFGLQSNYAEFSRKTFNWAAGLTWFLTLGTCVTLVYLDEIIRWLGAKGVLTLNDNHKELLKYLNIQIYFVSLPGWFIAAVLYVVLSKLYQKKIHQLAAPQAG
jgi:purine-cytosine permease-like protein